MPTKDFLETGTSPVEGVRLRHIEHLLLLLQRSGIRNSAYLRQRFVEVGTNFDETLTFLRDIRAIEYSGSEILCTGSYKDASQLGQGLHAKIIESIVNHGGPIRDELFTYLRRFGVVDGVPTYAPTDEERTEHVALRNLLIEMNVVECDIVGGQYHVGENFATLFTSALRRRSAIGQSHIDRILQERRDIGTRAEEHVVAYEQRRVGDQWRHRVQHVAVVDATAGFDVESLTIQPDTSTIPRLIEVKAVSRNERRFYWTANEVAVARAMGSWYWLYLVSIDGNGGRHCDSLQMICDPAKRVLKNKAAWSVEAEVFKCEDLLQ